MITVKQLLEFFDRALMMSSSLNAPAVLMPSALDIEDHDTWADDESAILRLALAQYFNTDATAISSFDPPHGETIDSELVRPDGTRLYVQRRDNGELLYLLAPDGVTFPFDE